LTFTDASFIQAPAIPWISYARKVRFNIILQLIC
jgi:hypothetical protein